MKKKQIIGILITGAVIIAVGFMGMLSNVVKDKLTQQTADTADVMSSLVSDNSVNLPSEDFVGDRHCRRDRTIILQQFQYSFLL